jgi:predicted helicase
MLKSYLKKIFDISNQGDATEASYYPALKQLLEEYAESIGKKNIFITTIPKQTEAGNPDFRVWDGKQHIVGYIEAKAPTFNYLDQIETTDQLKRYINIFPNLILTNFYEFRLYRKGILIDKVIIARSNIAHKLRTVPVAEKETDFFALLSKYFLFLLPKVSDAKNLATELAKRTRFLRDEVIAEELQKEKSAIFGFYDAFRKYLISGLTEEEFADLYSQTITYGLFAARTRSENGFNRKLAYDYIPRTIGILRDVFKFISLEDLPQPMEWIIDDISEVLAVTDVKNILHQYFHEGKGKDPIVHFYETFLAEYDPKTREKRGVYYTPEPVVSYIVRSLHQILKEHFDRRDGFAESSVTVLDPAAGTLTFLAESAKLAVEEYVKKYGEAGKASLIKDHILRDFYAFELMMAPYAVGHLKMSFLLEELGYKLDKDDRFKLYLTNTLEMKKLAQTELPGMSSLSEESHLAEIVKKQTPILVILGNPPYSVSSANKSDFIEKEMELYKEDVRDEKNIQPLSDDYIKFIRFAHWKIDKTGEGVIGMITNNSYLSGLIHRGMRKKLYESFNEIYILNLHGNSRIGEKSPDNSKDENVFDIMQGVSIILLIKSKDQQEKKRVFYQDVYGLREKKYEYLDKYYVNTTKWLKLQPIEPYFFFDVRDFSEQAKYDKFFTIPAIFIQSSSGVKTHRDHFLVGIKKEEIVQKMVTFTSNLPDESIKTGLDLKDTRDWKIKTARENLKKLDWEKYVRKYAYRPFDTRYICYVQDLIDRGCDRWDLMKNFFEENLGLATTRKISELFGIPAFICNNVGDIHLIGDQNYFFPLFIYPEKGKPKKHSGNTMMIFEPKVEYEVKKSNINQALIEQLTREFKKTPTPEQIFYYIYAVLYSNAYRTKYAEFLKIDFPRIPFTKDYKLFMKLTDYGHSLTDLHLLKSKETESATAQFNIKGKNEVEKVKYEKGKVYINKEQYFEGVKPEVWEYQIGGYQVCDKWLKDRKGMMLSHDDIKHYCQIVNAITKTIETQKKIDNIYPEVEKQLLNLP